MFYSVVIAIYNRSEELRELLVSFQSQTLKNFEILIIDDGSEENLGSIVDEFAPHLAVYYFRKENSGPGLSRNYGAQRAKGDYLIFVDSDCLVPKDYIENIHKCLSENPVDAFGGSDTSHKDFNHIQKAISFSMTSFLTTGGIRGGKKALTRFQPRSFNMGIQRSVFNKVGGFSDLRIGEDPDLSLRLWEEGYRTAYFPSITVYHKRRNTLRSFAKQVYQFGIARPILNQRHPQYNKAVFWFPSLFLIGFVVSLGMAIYGLKPTANPIYFIPITLYLIYFKLVSANAFVQTKSVPVAFWAIICSAIQLFFYGLGFLQSWVTINVCKKDPKKAFPSHFYG